MYSLSSYLEHPESPRWQAPLRAHRMPSKLSSQACDPDETGVVKGERRLQRALPRRAGRGRRPVGGCWGRGCFSLYARWAGLVAGALLLESALP